MYTQMDQIPNSYGVQENLANEFYAYVLKEGKLEILIEKIRMEIPSNINRNLITYIKAFRAIPLDYYESIGLDTKLIFLRKSLEFNDEIPGLAFSKVFIEILKMHQHILQGV